MPIERKGGRDEYHTKIDTKEGEMTSTGRRFSVDTLGVLFFDILNSGKRNLERRPAEQRAARDQAVTNAVRIMNAARQRGVPLFYTQPDHRHDMRDFPPRLSDRSNEGSWQDPEEFHAVPPGSYGGTWDSMVIDELKPAPEDTVVTKHRWNAFHQTHLELSLRTAGVNTIALLGGSLEVGIIATAYGARDHDFNIILIKDAITAHATDPATIAVFMEQVFPRFCLVRTTDWLVERLQR